MWVCWGDHIFQTSSLEHCAVFLKNHNRYISYVNFPKEATASGLMSLPFMDQNLKHGKMTKVWTPVIGWLVKTGLFSTFLCFYRHLLDMGQRVKVGQPPLNSGHGHPRLRLSSCLLFKAGVPKVGPGGQIWPAKQFDLASGCHVLQLICNNGRAYITTSNGLLH